MKRVKFGDKTIGKGEPVFIVAEIGYNFTTLDEALRTIDAAIDCGVDAVKFQTFKADTVTTRDAMFPPEAGGGSQYEEFKKYELSEEMHQEIFGYAKEKGIIIYSTPSHPEDVELLERIGVPAYKIGADDLTNLPFLRYVAKKGRPMIVSTGMATMAEVDEAVSTIRSAGNGDIVLMHCVSNYPVEELDNVNLNAIATMERAFELPVGFSDHTTTLSTPIAAVAMGAVTIERHFTLDKKLPVPDAFFSADPEEMKAIVQGIREVEKAMGDGIKRPASTESEMRSEARKGLVAAKAISKGTAITDDMVCIKRPGSGVAPEYLDVVLGRRTSVDIKEDEVITWDKVEKRLK